jgi:hypothetical protein
VNNWQVIISPINNLLFFFVLKLTLKADLSEGYKCIVISVIISIQLGWVVDERRNEGKRNVFWGGSFFSFFFIFFHFFSFFSSKNAKSSDIHVVTRYQARI